jgi:C_GCAxxG_C_C family probable redox protein
VLLALAEQQGIRSDVLPQIATGFCSGMARTAGFCGALSGAMMGIGLVLGRREPGASVDPAYAAVQQLLQRFQAQFGSLNCQELTGCHLGTPEGQAKFKAENRSPGCYNFAATATRLAVELIQEHQTKRNDESI